MSNQLKDHFLSDESVKFYQDLNAQSPIEALALSRRTVHLLHRAGIRTAGQLIAANPENLLSIKMVGPKTLDEIHEAVQHIAVQEQKQDNSYAEGKPRLQEIALSNGITEMPEELSWVGLLELGYDWETVEAFDAALHMASLTRLTPFPLHTIVGIETVCSAPQKLDTRYNQL